MFQPYVSLTGTATYNDIRLPQPWGRTTFWLVGPRFDVTLTNTLYFTTFVQYNEQQNNLNVNTRLQWRYKPASDVFLVWTDNYVPDYLQPGQNDARVVSVRNRARRAEVDVLVESVAPERSVAGKGCSTSQLRCMGAAFCLSCSALVRKLFRLMARSMAKTPSR